MSGSYPLNAKFDVSTVRLILKDFLLLFPVRPCVLLVESMLFFPSVALFTVLFVSVDPSPLVSAAPPTFASGVDPLPSVIVAYHPIASSEQTIPGLFLPFGVNIIEFDDRFGYLSI